MALLEILKFPDPRLRQKATSVEKITDGLKELAKNMLETMYEKRGVGLAAPQVGETIRLIVMDCRPRDKEGQFSTEGMTEIEKTVENPIMIFNPEIVITKGKTSYEEGCLSLPSYYEFVERAKYVEVKGLDIEGKEIWVKSDGLTSICIQHEIDHLEGKLFIDRLSLIKSTRLKNRIKKYGYPQKNQDEDEADEGERRL